MGVNRQNAELVTKKVMQLAVMEANDIPRKQKLMDLFGVDVDTASERDINNCDVHMSRWRKLPEYATAWKEAMKEWDFSDYQLARSVFRKGMRQDKDAWLAMNSAVNALSNASKRIFADESTAVVVKFEGSAPDLGSPDDE